MPYHVFVTVTGGNPPFKGESTQKGQENKFEAVSVSYGILAPIITSIGTGASAGKVQLQPLVITKEWGASSPQFFATAFTGQHLPGVMIEFFSPSGDGILRIDHTVKLTNVLISQIQDNFQSPDGRELHAITLQYQKIEIANANGATAASS